MDNGHKISVVLNTYNGAEYLDEVLEAVKDFDEIVVCDMESIDDTREIAQRHGARIVNFPKGDITICEPARNTAIQSASHDWVLVIDADEIVTPQLREYLYEAIRRPDCPEALMVPRHNMLLDGYDEASYPDYQCRFLRKDKTDWPATIHAKPIIDGCVEKIPKSRKELALIHKPLPMANYFAKICTYTDNEVVRRKGKKVGFANLMFEPAFRFFKSYILKKGFLGGKIGYIQAKREAFYRFMLLCKLYEYNIANEDRAKSQQK